MSIDKIGKMDQVAGINQQSVHHRQPKAADNDNNDALIREPGAARDDLTKISYPPFLPIGDTQSIYKK